MLVPSQAIPSGIVPVVDVAGAAGGNIPTGNGPYPTQWTLVNPVACNAACAPQEGIA